MGRACGHCREAARRSASDCRGSRAWRARGFDDGSGRAIRSQPSEAMAIVDALSDDELARHLEAPTRLAGTELYLGRYADGERMRPARWPWRGRLARASSCSPSSQLWAGWRLRGKLAEAGELLDGGIEAARLLGNTHAWYGPSLAAPRSAARGRRGARARRGARGLRPQRKISTRASTRPRQPWIWPVHSSSRGSPTCGGIAPWSAGGEDLVLIAGGPRAHYLELLARCWLALDRPADAKRAADSAEAWASALQLPMAPLGPIERRRPSTSTPGRPAASSRAGAHGGGGSRRGRSADRGSALADARGPRPRPSRRA